MTSAEIFFGLVFLGILAFFAAVDAGMLRAAASFWDRGLASAYENAPMFAGLYVAVIFGVERMARQLPLYVNTAIFFGELLAAWVAANLLLHLLAQKIRYLGRLKLIRAEMREFKEVMRRRIIAAGQK